MQKAHLSSFFASTSNEKYHCTSEPLPASSYRSLRNNSADPANTSNVKKTFWRSPNSLLTSALAAWWLLFAAAETAFAAGYTDSHDDGSYTGWTVYGSRTWSETGGYAVPADANNNQGFLINNYSCTNDGTYEATIRAISSYNNYHGGIVFRWTSTSAYYFLSLYEQNASGTHTENKIKVFSNTTDWTATPLTTISNLNFSGLSSHYPIKIVISGSSFTIYLNNVNIGSFTNSTHTSGRVGYAYHSNWVLYTSFAASTWTDGGGSSGGGTDDYTTWSYSTSIKLNTTSSGSNVGSNVLNFPVLIRLNPGNFANFSQTLDAGADIRFAKTDGTHLPYQIERWVDGTSNVDTAEIWVKLDTVYGNNSSQSFKMYWGKTGAADSSSGSTVFGTGNNYVGVWHMKEDPNGDASGAVKDITSNANNGTPTGSMTTSDLVGGHIGKGIDFDGSNDGITIADAASLDITSSITISAWVKPASVSGWVRIFSKASSDPNSSPWNVYLLGLNGSSKLQGMLLNNSSTQYYVNGNTDVVTGSFQYAVFRLSGTTMSLSLNGVAQSSTNTFSGTISTNNSVATIGKAGAASDYFSGIIDEVVVANTGRSDDWIKLCYENQKASQTLISLPADYTWDTDVSSGTTAAGGTWGTNSYWSATGGGGTSLVAWPGAGNSATFAGTDGTYAITINATQYVDSITFSSGTYTLSGGTALDFGSKKGISVASGKSAVISTPITGTGGLTLTGGGTLTLGGTNTYTGATTLTSGTLLVTGSLNSGSAVTVSSGATLGGTGTVSGTVAANGAISPGTTGTGTLTIGNSLTFSSTGSHNVTLNGTTAGSGYDRVVMSTGTLTLANAVLNVTLGFAPSNGNTFTIINNGGSNAVSGTFSGRAEGSALSLSYGGTSYNFTISYTTSGAGNDVVLTCTGAASPDNYATWSYSTNYSLNTTSSGANVANNVTNFPLLLRLNPGNFSYFSQTLANGADIRFAKSNGTHIPYKIERWVDGTSNSDTAEIWLKIDTVYGNNSSQTFTMYWGKASVADSSNAALVFDTANGFVGAWFMNESSGSALDYTANALNGTNNGDVPDRKAGMIGYGHEFDGTGDYFNAGSSSKFDMSANDKVTIMAWVKPAGNAAAGTVEGIVSKWRWNGATAYEYELFEDQTNGFCFGVSGTGSDYVFLYDSVGAAPSNGTWYHVVGTMDASKMRIFVNGTQKDSTNKTTIASGTTNSDFKIGMIDDNGTYQQYYNGIIDHVTLAKTNRSADYIKLCYENQKASQTLIVYASDYTWDLGTGVGITTGNGTWSTSDANWSKTSGTGTTLTTWQGTGNSATFAGSDGPFTITVSGTQNVDSITFSNTGYTVSSGTLNLGTKSGIYTASVVYATIGSVVTGTGGLAKWGSGNLTLTGSNTYTGTTYIKTGTVYAGHNSAFNNTAVSFNGTTGRVVPMNGITIANNATVSVANAGTGIGVFHGPSTAGESATWSGTIAINANCTSGGHFVGGNATGGLTISGAITAASNINVQIRSGRMTMSGGGTYYSLWVQQDTTRLGAANGISTSAVVDVATSGTAVLNLNGYNQTLAGLTRTSSNSATVTNTSGTAATLTLNQSSDYTFPGVIAGNLALVKQGTGRLTLSGANTYSGATTISADTLELTGSIGSGAVSVASGATLTGNGTIGGAVTITGTLSPGVDGAGTLTVGGDLSFASGSALIVAANGTTAGSGYDQIAETGTVTLGGFPTLTFSLGYGASILDSFVIINNDGSDAVSGTLYGLAELASFTKTYGGSTYTLEVSYVGGTGNDVVLTVISAVESSGYSEWSFNQPVYLNTTATGANTTADVTNFPVLIRLNPGNFDFFNQTQPGGKDIRFTKSSGVSLSYTIERWVDYDNNQDTAEIWVKVDTVYANNKTQYFKMYWGKSDAADSSNSGAVFDTANGFLGVWHLNEDPTGGTGAIKDVTKNALHATSTGSMTASDLVDGQIFKGHDMDGSNDGDSVPTSTKFDLTTAVTLSAWFKPNAVSGYSRICAKPHTANSAPYNMYSLNLNGSSKIRAELSVGGTQYSANGATTLTTTYGYYHAAFSWNNDTMKLFLNGVREGDQTVIAGPLNTAVTPFVIGKSGYSTTSDLFNGIIDEVRVEKSARSPSWIKLCYENQKTSQSLVSLEEYSTWGFFRNITINTNGVISTSNCVGFPLLVRLTSSNFDFNQARDSGQDLRFAKSNGQKLAYQIERYSKASQVAEIWVRVDTVYHSNSTQYIKMYWGKNTVGSRSNGAEVFGSSDNHRMALHFGGDITDATGRITLTDYSSVDTSSGIIGRARAFNGSNQYITAGDLADRPAGTISFWMRVKDEHNSGITSSKGIWGKYQDDNYNGTICLAGTDYTGGGGAGKIQTKVDNSSGVYLAGSTSTFTAGTWYHVAWSIGNSTNYIYLNGTQENSSVSSGTIGNTGTDEIGRTRFDNSVSGSFTGYFKGTLDEFRIDTAQRSADWIKLCYYTQKSDASVLTNDSADAFRPLGLKRYGSSSSPDSIYIGNTRWALRFAANKGGGIKFLAADTAGTNQLDANLFSVLYNGHSSDTGTGTLTLLDSSIVFARVQQNKTISGQPFVLYYTILGSGKLFVRIGATATTPLSGGLEFRIANNATATYRNISFGSTASTCKGVVHIDSGTAGSSAKYDIIMAPYDLFAEADQITTNSKYTGLKSSTYSAVAGKTYFWEYLVDFGHKTLTDSALAYLHVADYRNSDTLGFYAGTPLLESAWEQHLKGMWAFDEGIGNTVADKSGNNHDGTISGTAHWTTGKWLSNADSLGGSDSVTVAHSADFNGWSASTMMAWIKPRSTLSSSMTILKKYSASNVGYKLTGATGGKIKLSLANGGSTVDLQSSATLATGVWYHVAAKVFMLNEQDFMMLYINGIPDTSRVVSLDAYYNTNTDALTIGNNFEGVVEDVRYYNENLTHEEIRAISLRGFSPGNGWYSLRADNNNTLHCRMHGYPYIRNLPVMQIKNWWATTVPTYVYVDGVGLTSGTDYYAAVDDNRNQLTIGFNRVITSNSTIYLDDNYQNGNKCTGPTKKIYCGVAGASNKYFWVKNTSGTYLGSAADNEFYLNWKMDTVAGYKGELWKMRSSVTDPLTRIDTSLGTELLTSSIYSRLGCYLFTLNGSYYPRFSDKLTTTFTYTVAESSQVRICLRINERVATNTETVKAITRWTIYPTGQIFKYDSLYDFSSNVDDVYLTMFLKDSTYLGSGATSNKQKKRAGLIFSQRYPDLIFAWLGMRNSTAFQSQPFSADTVSNQTDATKAGFWFGQWSSAPALWTTTLDPIQTAVHIDLHSSSFNASSVDSVSNGVQNIGMGGGAALIISTGSLVTNSAGDLNTDGFNDAEGAYIVSASSNTVKFVLPSHGDTCRYYPAFRITNYTAVNKPRYVFAYKKNATVAADTIALLEGYQFNSYVNQSAHELVIQIDSIFCDSVGLFISSDKTLAVKMSSFEARAGNRSDTLLWRTESEHENQGYRIMRRINPEYLDSMVKAGAELDSAESGAQSSITVNRLLKRKLIKYDDTSWILLNKKLIAGAPSGTSFGPRDYRYVDNSVYNGVQYDYRLIAVDFRQKEEDHGPVSAIPRHIAPARFMLGINYPNPFRHTTRIQFALPVESKVTLDIYTIQGRLVRRLVKPTEVFSADNHVVVWDGKNESGNRVAAGQYLYRMSTGQFVKSKRMLMLR